MVWNGVVWFGMVWYGLVWFGMVWYGLVQFGMVWNLLNTMSALNRPQKTTPK